MPRRLRASFLAGVLFVGASCGHGGRPRNYAPPGEQLILREDIAQSGADNAWDVVRRLSTMTTASSIAGEPTRMYRRGRGSLVIRETPVVVVDGVSARDIQILIQIPAAQIAWMRVLTGAASTTRFGARGGAGAIIVQTGTGEPVDPGQP